MTNISIESLKEKTIGEICELVKQAESLPENNSPQTKPQKKLSDKNLEGLSSVVHEPYVDFGMGDKTGGTKTQTAQELLEEIKEMKDPEVMNILSRMKGLGQSLVYLNPQYKPKTQTAQELLEEIENE